MNRWKVKKSKWLANPPVGASSVYTGSWHVESNDGEYAAFATHAEALAYADRMARKVEVVLPREAGHIQLTNQTCVYIHSNGGVSITKRAHHSHVGIPKVDLKPLALALLAHHHQQEKTDGNV